MSGERRRARSSGLGSGYGERVAERLRSPSRAGRLEAPDARGEAGSTTCGALIRLQLAISEGTLRDARYEAYGCPATLASAMEVADRAKGLPIIAAAAISAPEISHSLGLVPAKVSSAELAVEALQAALTNAVSSGLELSEARQGANTLGVLVGMSGGVDSTVAAMLLKEEGYRVVGVTLKLWEESGTLSEEPEAVGGRSCCSRETVSRARRAAHNLGIPHITIDASETFYNQVVEYFLDEYRVGRTPNPCAKCNSRLRFALMLDVAQRLGLSHVATGHYARMAGDPPSLSRAADQAKDQSYVLAEVSPDILRHVIFPLGGMTKVQVRALAAERAVEGHAAPESQEICFVPDDDHRRFLSQRLGEQPGRIVDQEGRVLGRHSGTYNYTVGQRRGLGIAGPEPLYVVAINAGQSEVIVGPISQSAVGLVTVGSLTWHRPPPAGRASIKLRSSGTAVAARLLAGHQEGVSEACEVVVLLEEPAYGVAPGQTAVMYDGESVVLAGTILSTAV